MKYYIEVSPCPTEYDYMGDPNSNEIRWRWEVREILKPNPDGWDFGRAVAGGINNTLEEAKQRAEVWAKAFSVKLAYVYDGD